MKLSLKQSGQPTAFEVEVEPNQTIADLKNKINEIKGYTIESQRLILSARPLADNETFDSIGVHDGGQIVLLITKQYDPMPPLDLPFAFEHDEDISTDLLDYTNDKGKRPMHSELDDEADTWGNGHLSSDSSMQGLISTANAFPMYQGPSGSEFQAPVGLPWSHLQTDTSDNLQSAAAGPSGSQNSEIESDPQEVPNMERMMRDDPQFRQYLIQRIAQENPEIGRHIKENPGLFDAAMQMASNRMDETPPLSIDVLGMCSDIPIIIL